MLNIRVPNVSLYGFGRLTLIKHQIVEVIGVLLILFKLSEHGSNVLVF